MSKSYSFSRVPYTAVDSLPSGPPTLSRSSAGEFTMVNHPQLQPSSASSSSLCLKPPCAGAEHDALLSSLTTLPLGHFLKEGGTMAHLSKRKGKKSSKRSGGSEADKLVGNDAPSPWRKPRPNREVKVEVTAGIIQLSAVLTTSTTVVTYAGLQFTASQMAEFSSWSTVFDQYRIREIEALIESEMNESTSSNADAGRWVSVIDVDDAATPVSLDVLTSYSSALTSSMSQAHYHRFAPGVAVDLYTGAFGGFGNVTSPWIDCGSSNIVHYGLKLGATASAVAEPLKMTFRLHVEFRCQR